MRLGAESGGDGDGAADACAGDEADDGGVSRRVGGGEIGAFEAEGGLNWGKSRGLRFWIGGMGIFH